MAIIQTGTSNDDELIIQSDSTSVQAGMGQIPLCLVAITLITRLVSQIALFHTLLSL